MLTDITIRNTKPREKPFKLFDGHGLFLLVTPGGGRWWRLAYRHGGCAKGLSLGVYPTTGLKDARAKRDEARRQLAAGIDPSAVRKDARRAMVDTFGHVAREWHASRAPRWVPGHARTVLRRLERDIFPLLGSRPVSQITVPELLACIRRIEARGTVDTGHRALQDCGQIFLYAIAAGRAERNPAVDIRGALQPRHSGHFAALTEPRAVGALLRAIDGYQGSFVTQSALGLAPLTFVRPGELRAAEWIEFDLEAAEWNIPAGRMKSRVPYLVPLSRQAVAILRELHPLTGAGRYVFPSLRSTAQPMSENTMAAALRRLGYTKAEMTPHGFRAMARTILDEVLGVRPDFIEHQLAHTVRDPLGRAYNRTTHLAERRAMMQRWADYLDGLKNGAEVIPLYGKLA